MQENSSSATDVRVAGTRVVTSRHRRHRPHPRGGRRCFCFSILPDADAFNQKVERIFVENDDLTSPAEIRLLEILAQSGTRVLRRHRELPGGHLRAPGVLHRPPDRRADLSRHDRRSQPAHGHDRAARHPGLLARPLARARGRQPQRHGIQADRCRPRNPRRARRGAHGRRRPERGRDRGRDFRGDPRPTATEAAGATRIKRLRDALGNQMVAELLIKTIARKGYMLAIDRDRISMTWDPAGRPVRRAGPPRVPYACHTLCHTHGRQRLAGNFPGDPGRIRTSDLPLRRRLLYPLSYGATAAVLAGLRAGINPTPLRSQALALTMRHVRRDHQTAPPPAHAPRCLRSLRRLRNDREPGVAQPGRRLRRNPHEGSSRCENTGLRPQQDCRRAGLVAGEPRRRHHSLAVEHGLSRGHDRHHRGAGGHAPAARGRASPITRRRRRRRFSSKCCHGGLRG